MFKKVLKSGKDYKTMNPGERHYLQLEKTWNTMDLEWPGQSPDLNPTKML